MNYGKWVVTMKVNLRARRLWKAIDQGTEDEEEDCSALEVILAAVPSEYREPLGSKDSTKEAWAALKAMHIGSDHVKKVKVQRCGGSMTTWRFATER